jgi:hypothetical protein
MYYQPEAAKALSALTCRALPVPYGTVSLHSIATSSRAFQLSPTTASRGSPLLLSREATKELRG